MPIGPVTPQDAGTDILRTRRNISTHWLYVAVILAVVAGTAVGLVFGKQAAGPAVLGTAFVNLITMMIGPVIFCIPTTLFSALTIGSVLQALFVGLVIGFTVHALGAKGSRTSTPSVFFGASRTRRDSETSHPTSIYYPHENCRTTNMEEPRECFRASR